MVGGEAALLPLTKVSLDREGRSDRKTVEAITAITETSGRPGPIELEQSGADQQAALLEALKNIGVIEERSEDRINMPDIFRVAAKIKRRGGVRPPVAGSRRS